MWSVSRLLAGLALAGAAFAAGAQDFPSRPVKIVNPFAPGSVVDVLARLMATQLQQIWKQPVIVENRSGAGGTLGAQLVAQAAPDGYTLLLTTSSTHAIAPAIRLQMPYDPVKDFTPITLPVRGSVVVVVNPNLPVKTLGDLVREAKARPGKISFGSAGIGTISHFGGELFAARTGVDLLHVPYKGGAPAAADLATGIVQVMFDSLGTQTPNIKAGKVRPIAVMLGQRTPVLPEVPTVGEAGFPQVEFSTWNGLFGPAGMPKELVAKIVAGVREALAAPDVREKLATMGSAVTMDSGEVLLKVLQADIQRFAELARQAKIERQ